METQTVKININGVDHRVAAGQNVLDACTSVGVEVPHFCYHENLSVAGNCRMCLVKIGMPARDRATGQLMKKADGSFEISWGGKPSIACGTNVAENMHVITDSEEVKRCRSGILEFILLNHPLDCPICDKAGECMLQEYAYNFGSGNSRFIEHKNVKPKNVVLDDKIVIDAERCIQCSRCIRICREVAGKDIFGFIKRGSKTEIDFYEGADNESNYLLNTVDNCPVGALTEKAFRFKMRAWFLKVTKSICAESSAGTNIRVWSRNGKIYRVTPRKNPFVNDAWMTDSGRYIFERFNEGNLLKHPRIDSSPSEPGYAASRAVEILKLGGVAIVANGWQTVEEQFLIGELAKACGAKIYMASHTGEDDGKLLSADRTPNMRGAFVTGIISEYPKPDLKGLAAHVRTGEIKTVLCFREDLCGLGFDSKDFKAANVIYCGALENNTSRDAKICIPVRSEFEKEGLWINRQFRLQKFEKAIEASNETYSDYVLLMTLLREVNGVSFAIPTIPELRKTISQKVPLLKGCENVGEYGLVIDGSAFAHIEFPEQDAMHFKKNASKA